MSAFDQQARFCGAAFDPAQVVPADLHAPHPADPTRRFAVYRNNVIVGLVDALGARFPVVQRLVGSEFFRAMAAVFVRANPPTSKLVAEFGDGFANFIASFEPVRSLPYLADVARLEAAITWAYHAMDARPIDLRSLGRVAPETLAASIVQLHSSVHAVPSPFAVVSIWRANTAGWEGALDASLPEEALIARPDLDVHIHLLPAGGSVFLAALRRSITLGEAVDLARAEQAGFDLAAVLTVLLRAGAIAGLSHKEALR